MEQLSQKMDKTSKGICKNIFAKIIIDLLKPFFPSVVKSAVKIIISSVRGSVSLNLLC